MKIITFVISICLLSSAVFAETQGDKFPEILTDPESFEERIKALNEETIYSQSCCKRCNKGKACGNSCISKSKSCRKGKGCACN